MMRKKKSEKNPRSQLRRMRMRYCLTIAGMFLGLSIVFLLAIAMLNLLWDPSPYIRLFMGLMAIAVSLWMTDRYITKNIMSFLLQHFEADDVRPERTDQT